ncbi:hypothetical protein MRX96_050939 [Rhipicephalus microplus]
MATSKSNSERSSASNHREDCRRSVDLRQSTSQDRSSVARHLVLRDASSGCPPTLFICPVIAAAVTGAAIFLQFFKTSTDKLPKDSVTESYSRSMDVMLQMLWLTGNSTLDPCKDFYRYVCYNYIAVHKEKGFFNTIQSPHLVLQGMSNNEAGRALFAYYRSCIFSQGSPIDAVRNAVRALLQMLYVSLDSTSLRMLIFIMKLNLVYGIHTDPLVYQNFQGRRPALVNYVIDSEEMFNSLSADGPQYLFILSDEYYICADNFDNTDFEKIYTAGLTELSSAINVNITFKEIVEFATQFCSVATYDGLNEANGTILGSIVKGVSSRLWKDIVEEFTHTEVGRVILSPVDVLKHRFNLLTSRSKKPVATALVVVHAAFKLSLHNQEETLGTSDRYGFCASSSYELYPLWMLNNIMSFDLQTEHNGVVMRVFNTFGGRNRHRNRGSVSDEVSRFDRSPFEENSTGSSKPPLPTGYTNTKT